ncbi:hypothetical protein TRVA0_100S00166 [Trichomonascus vanleenenianus]|uniref:uncharacterized protein n=1 Tax=Trichomonascus vanleenenianus TaxID=2268995 RepID=UPI003EC9ED4D
MGSIHIENLESTRFVQVVAICTVVENEKQWARDNIPGAQIFDDFDTFVAQENIDAVWISSPTGLHEEHVSKSLAAGKHVFCEKPLSGDKNIAWKMYELSLQYPDLKVACGFVRRFAAVYKEARQAIANGAIGDVIAVRSSTSDNFNPAKQFLDYIKGSGGIFVDCSIHDIDISLFLVGEDKAPKSAFATGTCKVYPKFKEWGDADNVHGLVEFENDLVFNLYASRDNKHGHHTTTEVIGTKGRIQINGEPRGLNVDISDETGTKMVSASDHQVLFAEAFKAEVVAFRDWVLFDKSDHGFNLKDAAKAVSIGHSLQKSLVARQVLPIALRD